MRSCARWRRGEGGGVAGALVVPGAGTGQGGGKGAGGRGAPRDLSDTQCYKCGQMGHRSFECTTAPTPPQN